MAPDNDKIQQLQKLHILEKTNLLLKDKFWKTLGKSEANPSEASNQQLRELMEYIDNIEAQIDEILKKEENENMENENLD